jgi:tellurite resistance protein TehA-like permease
MIYCSDNTCASSTAIQYMDRPWEWYQIAFEVVGIVACAALCAFVIISLLAVWVDSYKIDELTNRIKSLESRRGKR